eukprot:SAG11_NODE_100_length_16863_cov_12.374911_10_plen_66_part_00
MSTDTTPEAALERLPDIETIVAMCQSSHPCSNHYLYGSMLNGCESHTISSFKCVRGADKVLNSAT